MRGERGGVLFHHYFLNKKTLILETLAYLKKSCFFDATASPTRWRFPQKIQVLSNSPFPFPFPQPSQEREGVILQFPFPQDVKEWPLIYFFFNLPAPMNHVKMFKGWPPRDAPSKLVQPWYKSFPTDQRGQLEMKKPTRLSNKTSTAWSCTEDQILEPEHDFEYFHWTMT